ncbi:putative membrane protein [Yersinia enterocolitica subsp. enterocolitica 8081]|uniref:Membrane protein n=1 Tax=Yersinia enterocolitica serotype O:8 / biotype 1B (strain NCTC 13174 / 8081) TaxID=393305 RepID=A1JJ44_YERE8|nr:putative membrane protein [Yersinia enterocolitica subsp. enterocolitica 8081]
MRILFIYLNYSTVILFILYVYSIESPTELMIRIVVRLVPSNSLYPNITFIDLLQGGALSVLY